MSAVPAGAGCSLSWSLVLAVAALVGGLVAAWWVRRRLVRLLATAHDERAREAHSARVEVAQLRHGLADEHAWQSAATVVDNALYRLSSQERDR